MNPRLQTIVERKRALIALSNLQREVVCMEVAGIRNSFRWVEWLSRSVSALKSSPFLAGGTGLFAALQASRASGWIAKGVSLWKTFSSLRRWWKNRSSAES